MTVNSNRFNILEYLCCFEPTETILWLQTVITHPNNQIFIPRIEYLIGLIFSLPKERYGSKIPTSKDIEFLFEEVDSEFSEIFQVIEDFEGYNQCNAVPIFIEGRRYFPFNGGLERPTEYYKHIADCYFLESKYLDAELRKFKYSYLNSLLYQSELLEKILEFDESTTRSERVYVPTDSFHLEIKSYFKCQEEQLEFSPARLGKFNDKSQEEILNSIPQYELFDSPYFIIENDKYYLYPQIHFNIYLKRGNRLLKSDSIRRNFILNNFKNRIFQTCANFFSTPKYIPAIHFINSSKNIIENIIDFAVLVDTNKLFLFCAVPHTEEENISEALKQTCEKLLSIKKSILQEKIIGIFQIGIKEPFGLRSADIEIWMFPIFEPITLNYSGSLNSGSNNDIIFPLSYMDLSAILKRIGKPFEFLKFLREDLDLKQKVQTPFMGEFMDRFAFYLQNGKSYHRSGREVSYIIFEPHIWHYYFMEESYLKHKDSTYSLIESKFPNFFNVQEKHKENVYRMMNTSNLNGAFLARLSNRDIWIYPPLNGYDQAEKDIFICYDIFMPLFADYLTKLDKPFTNLLESYEDSYFSEFSIFIFPKSFIEKTKELQYLQTHYNNLTKDNPIIFDIRQLYGLIRISVVYDSDLVTSIFSVKENLGERYCIKGLLKCILDFFGESQSEKIADDFIDTNLPQGIKGYSIEEFAHINPKLNEYYDCIKLNDTDIARTSRKVSEYLIKNKFKIGEYIGEDAKNLAYKVYCFLQNLLEDKIQLYNESLLFYSYRELELNEGERESKKLKSGMQAKGRVEYDIVNLIQERESELSELSLANKHIIHSILKVGVNGNKIITTEEWTELLAISNLTLSIAMIYDYINYDLRKHILIINNHYVLEDMVSDEIIDSVSYTLDIAKIKLENAKDAHEKATNPKPVEPIEIGDPVPEEINKINASFLEEFGFTYENLIFVLYALRGLDYYNDAFFPVTIISIQDLVKGIQRADRLKIEASEINSIIEFLSMKEGIFKVENLLIPSEMMRNKERINVSPFIKLKDDKILYGNEVVNNSMKFWTKVHFGDFPYKLPKNSIVQKIVDARHKELDRQLEFAAEKEAKEILGKENVESRILNFKRLSNQFQKQESCGEIDLLCINRNTNTIFVFDAKNISKKINLYHIRQNINDFFEGNKSHFYKLDKKRQFIETNLSIILKHFNVNKVENWKVKQAFISNEIYFAAYYFNKKVDFIGISEMRSYLEK